MRLWWGWLVVGALAGCSGTPDGAVRVVVQLTPASQTRCVVVEARGAKGKVSTGPINRKSKSELKVGVHRSAELAGKIEVQAIGYAQDGCPDGTQIERSASVAADLDAVGVQIVTLTLDRPTQGDGGTSDGGTDGGTDGGDPDGDNDGYPKSIDCNDQNPNIHPGQTEACANNLDDDCDLLIDCQESFCLGATCNDSNPCTDNDKCVAGEVCFGTLKVCATPGTCENNPGGCVNGACVYAANIGAPCGDGGACRSDKTCGTGEVNCANGLDDDLDGGADCLDPNCAAQDCDAGVLLCYGRAACTGTACVPVPASMVTCTPPSGGCFSGGACSPDAGCTFTQAMPGATCPAGSCRTDGGCGAIEAGAACANALDDDGDGLTDCADPSCAGGTCNDNDACTTGTTCASLLCAGGAGVVCPAGPLCTAPLCLADAGCTYPFVPPGTACGDGGICGAGGTCTFDAGVPDAGPPDAGPPDAGPPDAGPPDAGPPDAGPFDAGQGFPYVPSNFDPSIPAAQIAGNITFNGLCNAVFDTTAGTWANNCLQAVPTAISVTQSGGELAWLLPFRSLTIDNNGSLRLIGQARPVIIAVYGNVDLNGTVNARSAGAGTGIASMGAGGNWSGCQALGMNGANGNTSAGGGGGAFGTDGGAGPNDGAAVGGLGGVGRADPLVPLHGGCRGGQGGGPMPVNGGAGGGAVQISAAGTLRVNNFITASGGSGLGALGSRGGSGAGSGGAIFLEANALDLTTGARLTCNGGGGGEGGGMNPGFDGDDGSPINTTPALGGTGNTNGGNGGNGAAGNVPAQTGFTDNNSTGGGGGGLGHIRLRAISMCLNSAPVLSGVLSKTANCPP